MYTQQQIDELNSLLPSENYSIESWEVIVDNTVIETVKIKRYYKGEYYLTDTGNLDFKQTLVRTVLLELPQTPEGLQQAETLGYELE